MKSANIEERNLDLSSTVSTFLASRTADGPGMHRSLYRQLDAFLCDDPELAWVAADHNAFIAVYATAIASRSGVWRGKDRVTDAYS